MSAALTCHRKWQVEAESDGRLQGADVQSAARHRQHCAECADERRRLAELTDDFRRLPDSTRDALSVRRSRQRLLSAFNESLLVPPRRPHGVYAALGLAATALAAFVLSSRKPLPSAAIPPAVEVRAAAGTRWQISSTATLDRVELSEGVATLAVHPHPGRRVVVQLPDGELEDLGTTFEVSVHEGNTDHIAVSEGRVWARLVGHPEFSLRAGEQWQKLSAAPAAPESAEAPNAPPSAPSARPTAPSASSGPHPSRSAASSVPRLTPPKVLDRDTAQDEDAAYLAVIALLNQQRYVEARRQARAYLLRFPNGFRRIEVLNVATSSEPGAAAP